VLSVIRRVILEGMRNSQYLFLTVLIVVLFVANGVVYSLGYRQQMEDYRETVAENYRLLQPACKSLQDVAVFEQTVRRPPSPAAFIADGGEQFLSNAVQLNAFGRWETIRQNAVNDHSPIQQPIDWIFIIGTLTTLLAVLLSYSSVSGEKQSGTLRQVLSNPLPRYKFVLAKYLGLMFCMLLTLSVGIASGLLTINLMDGPAINQQMVEAIGWALVFAVLTISLFLLTGLAISSLTGNSTVSMVVLLVFWIFAVVIVPGVGKLAAEQIVIVPSDSEVRAELDAQISAVYEATPPETTGWTDDLFGPLAQRIMSFREKERDTEQRIKDDYLDTQLSEAMLAQQISSASPSGLLSDSLQGLCSTGVYGLRNFVDMAEEYRRQLKRFVIERDSQDGESPHLVFGFRSGIYPGAFSGEPVPFETIPRYVALWDNDSRRPADFFPIWQLLYLLFLNLNVGLLAVVIFSRADIR
jgi:ABC-type transport system involved in multi-copper enzyme maturation permease subunit